MKHGIRHWQKKLGRTPSHRQALLRSLLTSLIKNERIVTTVAKAKFVQHAADKLIASARRATPEIEAQTRSLLYTPNEVMPKLFGTLVERYKDRKGGFTRVMRFGYRSVATDRAPMAIIELVGNPRDTVRALAEEQLEPNLQRLRELEANKYIQEKITLVDPLTFAPVECVRLMQRQDLTGKQMKRLDATELNLHKTIDRMQVNKDFWESARERESARVERVRSKLQGMADAIKAAEMKKEAVVSSDGSKEGPIQLRVRKLMTNALGEELRKEGLYLDAFGKIVEKRRMNVATPTQVKKKRPSFRERQTIRKSNDALRRAALKG
ncbi:ribosomal protein L17 [Cladochytrium replicatum]|nr:ribosomal protein L17 [Cladochytrium replicatum]